MCLAQVAPRFQRSSRELLQAAGIQGYTPSGTLVDREMLAGSRGSAAAPGNASGEVGVTEQPPGSNRGPQVDDYLTTVGLNPAGGSFAWCSAFVYWCFRKASEELAVPNPAVKTAGALDVWNLAIVPSHHRDVRATAA
jgi:hypothetical protein